MIFCLFFQVCLILQSGAWLGVHNLGLRRVDNGGIYGDMDMEAYWPYVDTDATDPPVPWDRDGGAYQIVKKGDRDIDGRIRLLKKEGAQDNAEY